MRVPESDQLARVGTCLKDSSGPFREFPYRGGGDRHNTNLPWDLQVLYLGPLISGEFFSIHYSSIALSHQRLMPWDSLFGQRHFKLPQYCLGFVFVYLHVSKPQQQPSSEERQ